jgi:putative membrane protein
MNRIIAQKELFLILILIIFHAVGLIGMNISSYRADVLSLSSMNLYISFFAVILARNHHFSKFILFVLLSFCLGMIYEIIGVKTGYLFGDYYYGANLGSKFMGVPFVIGCNWAILSISSGNLIHKLKTSIYLKTLLASLLMVLLDFMIEPIAMELDYWQWKNGEIPVYNYICWFVLSLPLSFLYFKLKLSEQNKLTNGLYLILVVFFGILLII